MNHAEMRKLPIGVEYFEKIRTQGYYYVDKTGMIRDLIRGRGEVNLFTRPRRFGKSLNMSMLKTFFEVGCDRSLFDGLEISNETELCEEYMGKFPVISISLKGANGTDYKMARSMLCDIIGNEAMRFQFLLDSDRLTDREKQQYEQMVLVDTTGTESFRMSDAALAGSLKNLSSLLEKHYGRKAIILIDEYDVPLAKANDRGYYDPMVILIRNLLENALKTNESLEFAVLTGCLRIAKESIFTGLNNLMVFSLTAVSFDEYFGFTDGEVKTMLEYYGLEGKYGSIKDWYDGYQFGNVGVYCPWDVVNCCYDLLADPELEPQNYWSNTSDNLIVRNFIERTGSGLLKREIEALVVGEAVTKEIRQELTYRDLYASLDNIWSVLFTTGYLTQRGKPEGRKCNLVIPNREVREIFTEQIMEMFKKGVSKDGETLNAFCEALKSGNAAEAESLFTKYLNRTVSIRDTFVRKPTKENFFHGILLGILGFKEGWYVRSNKESGNGYSDISIEIEDEEIGILIEVKYAEEANFDSVCAGALKQIEGLDYMAEFREEGYHTIYKYGIACYKKKCRVVVERE